MSPCCRSQIRCRNRPRSPRRCCVSSPNAGWRRSASGRWLSAPACPSAPSSTTSPPRMRCWPRPTRRCCRASGPASRPSSSARTYAPTCPRCSPSCSRSTGAAAPRPASTWPSPPAPPPCPASPPSSARPSASCTVASPTRSPSPGLGARTGPTASSPRTPPSLPPTGWPCTRPVPQAGSPDSGCAPYSNSPSTPSWPSMLLTADRGGGERYDPAPYLEGSDGSPVRPRLDPVQLGVPPAAGHQLFVAADLCQARPVQHHNEVGHADGAEPVGHQDGHAPAAPGLARPAGIALEQLMLGLGVERGRRLVQRRDQRLVAHEPAGQGELLPLPVGDVDTLVPGRAELGAQPS